MPAAASAGIYTNTTSTLTGTIGGFAVTGDAASDQLVRWASRLAPPRRTFVVHGEPDAARALARRFEAELGFTCETPDLGDSFELGAG